MTFSRSYYWRAVHSIARAQGITVAEARGKDWRSVAGAEKQRRSDAAKTGADTRETRRREREEPWKIGAGREYIVEEPIDTVGGTFGETRKKRRR